MDGKGIICQLKVALWPFIESMAERKRVLHFAAICFISCSLGDSWSNGGWRNKGTRKATTKCASNVDRGRRLFLLLFSHALFFFLPPPFLSFMRCKSYTHQRLSIKHIQQVMQMDRRAHTCHVRSASWMQVTFSSRLSFTSCVSSCGGSIWQMVSHKQGNLMTWILYTCKERKRERKKLARTKSKVAKMLGRKGKKSLHHPHQATASSWW